MVISIAGAGFLKAYVSMPCVCVILPVVTFETLWTKPTKCKRCCLVNSVPTRSVKLGSCKEKRPATGQDAMVLNELNHY